MKYFRHLETTVVVFSLLYLVFHQTAYAYLDPGTGSYIFQLAIAVLIGGTFAIKLYWRKIKTFFGNLFFKKTKR